MNIGTIIDAAAADDPARAALIIDWLLFTVMVVAARTGYVMVRHLIGMLTPRRGPSVLILGAGEEAAALVPQG